MLFQQQSVRTHARAANQHKMTDTHVVRVAGMAPAVFCRQMKHAGLYSVRARSAHVKPVTPNRVAQTAAPVAHVHEELDFGSDLAHLRRE